MFKRVSKFLTSAAFVIAGSFPISFTISLPTNAQPAGCGSGSSYYLLRHAAFPIASRQFHVACVEHDQCYDTYGKTQAECDKAFHNRMLDICARDHNTILGKPLRIACNGRADAFYTAVQEFGGEPYRKAQQAATPPHSIAIKNSLFVNQWQGKCLDADISGGGVNGNKIHLWDCSGENNQRWSLGNDGLLRNQWNNKCLDADISGGGVNGNKIHLWDCSGENNQRWSLGNDGLLRNQWNNKCLDADISGGGVNGNKIHLWDCSGENNQKWSPIP